jgi:hypothetical protein
MVDLLAISPSLAYYFLLQHAKHGASVGGNISRSASELSKLSKGMPMSLKSDGKSPKKMILYLDGNSLTLQRADPKNSDELEELMGLDIKGLTKVLVIDTSASFIADKRVLQRLRYDVSSSRNLFFEIIDRSQQGHNYVQIFASNIWLRKYGLTSDQYQKSVCEEDMKLEGYNELKCK